MMTVNDSSRCHLSAGRAEAVLVCADAVPAEATDLVATGAGEEVDVVDLQRLHAQGALHEVVLWLRAVGHPMALRGVTTGMAASLRTHKVGTQLELYSSTASNYLG